MSSTSAVPDAGPQRGRRARRAIAAFALLPAIALTAGASPAQATDYGPETCLNGFVWRGATAADRACVSTTVRSQVVADNAAAASRRNPYGASGPDTCISGYVWREAVEGDHVCVTLTTRSQARADNDQIANRRDTIVPFVVGGSLTSPVSLAVDHINIGPATVEVYNVYTDKLYDHWDVTVPPASYMPGGRLDLRTRECLNSEAAPGSWYFQITDRVSGRSVKLRVPLNVSCLF